MFLGIPKIAIMWSTLWGAITIRRARDDLSRRQWRMQHSENGLMRSSRSLVTML
jgi:hypothetical protein